MNRFEEGHDPLSERIGDGELRELLDRLGKAEFGGDERATVGVVVEVTGADSATVLRILGEMRKRALDQQRATLAAMEHRVERLESRSITAAPRVVYRKREEPSKAAKTVQAVVALVIGFVLLVVFLAATHRERGSSTSNGTIFSVQASDGTVTLGAGGNVSVVRHDGSTRAPTPEEEAEVEAFAAVVGGKR